ncbi:transcription factor MYB59-like [Hibiscus syriacus]|uniref:Transcription factor MYB59-like n=1 Tax=Hibiscus syriacus TaxID=106335 RepID=A0A6A2WGF9_HIBSY|nr:protein UPSTREAM OF FLC-like [Hibiscus syriacus]KAE8656861.1 transcription factor MYB59-like [Hibiscus syriacus]
MAVSSEGKMTEFGGIVSRKWNDRKISPERNKVWIEPKSHNNKSSISERKVTVVYYLSRNGQLEQPHFMEVPLSSNDGLYLKDVINRLNLLRGKGMASLYSWSSKRSYKNGFVWHDLAENDSINPSHGEEYILKGSEIVDHSISSQALDITSSSFRLPKPSEYQKSENEREFRSTRRLRNQSWSSIDLHEYKVYKAESSSESARRLAAADASTQTDDKRRRRKPVVNDSEIEEMQSTESQSQDLEQNHTTELSREEISPPPSDSSPETLETLMKADGRLRLGNDDGNEDSLNRRTESCSRGRIKAASVLMQLVSCGSISFKDCGASTEEADQGFSLIGHYKSRLLRGAGNCSQVGKEAGIESFSRVTLEDKEYFSGSLIETQKEQIPNLKRSSSYNADRSSQLQLAGKEMDGVRAKCIPRKLKT